MEAGFVRECLDFVEQVSLKFNLSTAVMGMSMHLFHFYSKQVPFTEVDRFMLASVAAYLSCKIDYIHMPMAEMMLFYHENKKGPKKRRPFPEVKDQLQGDFSDLERKLLKMIGFDFEFQLPFDSLRAFRDRWLLRDGELEPVRLKAVSKVYDTAKRVVFHSYQLDLCLYFPAPIIAAAALLIADKAFAEGPFESFTSGRDYLQGSFLGLPFQGECLFDRPELVNPANGRALTLECPHLQFLLLRPGEHLDLTDSLYVANQLLTRANILHYA